MVGILVASHGQMAEGMLDSLGLLIGEKEGLDAICLKASDSADVFQKNMEEKVNKLDSGDGVLIFTDILGGTPGNRALAIAAANDKVEVIAGVNLPVLLNVAISNDTFGSAKEAVDAANEIAEGSIVHASAQLRQSADDMDDDLDSAMD